MSTYATIQANHSHGETPSLAAISRLSVVTHLDPRYGGLSAVVPQLSQVIAETHQAHMSLAGFCSADEQYSSTAFTDVSVTEWPASRAAWARNATLSRHFSDLVGSVASVHVHGLWEQSTFVACQAARRRQVPYVISAHGMLDRWALKNKLVKKFLYSALVERKNLQKASCLHALTEAEAEDFRRYGCNSPVAIIPNGVSVPLHVSTQSFLSQYPALKGKRLFLFLGRIHFKKGLDLLVQAWRQISLRWPDGHLVLAGPDFEGTQAAISKLIEEHGLGKQISFTGMLRGEMKWSALAAAECFVLPSYSEGLSVSVLEAMGVGLPVIVSEQCNLPEVAALDAGWVVPSDVASLQNALYAALENSPRTNAVIGARGRDYVRLHYDWSRIADQMIEVYRWIEGGSTPTSVNLRAGGRK